MRYNFARFNGLFLTFFIILVQLALNLFPKRGIERNFLLMVNCTVHLSSTKNKPVLVKLSSSWNDNVHHIITKLEYNSLSLLERACSLVLSFLVFHSVFEHVTDDPCKQAWLWVLLHQSSDCNLETPNRTPSQLWTDRTSCITCEAYEYYFIQWFQWDTVECAKRHLPFTRNHWLINSLFFGR